MPFLLFVLMFAVGTIVGSFLNVLVLRYGTRSLLGRSSCASCGKVLQWFELIPIASFILERGRCRGCKSPLSWQYPIIEALTGLVFTGVYYRLFASEDFVSSQIFNFQFSRLPIGGQAIFNGGGTEILLVTILHFAVWSALVTLAVYDFRHKILPNGLIIGFLSLSFLNLAISYKLKAISSLALWGGPLLALPFAAVWFFSRGRAMGLGDAKLMLGFPWLVGFIPALSAVIIGFWIGALAALAALLLKTFVSAYASPLPKGVPDTTLPRQSFADKTFAGTPFIKGDLARRGLLSPLLKGAALGGCLPLPKGVPPTFSEKWGAGVVSAHLYSLKAWLKNLTIKSELPLAPFLVLGLFIVYVWGIDVTGIGIFLAE